jgi:hypothetical protein
MSASTSPVIIIGMHRSGTSLLTRVLQQAGLFMGRGASRNEEAAFTNAVNGWLFRQASATWDRPESVDWLWKDEQLWPWLVDYVDGITRGPASMRFLGPGRWWRYRGLDGVTGPWGFKDPRNTYTLPLWRALFPEARVIHIMRHGVDVAASLRARRQAVLEANLARYERRRRLYRGSPWAPKRRGFGPQPRCASLEGGLNLWSLYVERAARHTEAAGEAALTLHYEDLLRAPRAELKRALAFCGLEAPSDVIDNAAATVDSRRAYAHRGDPELAGFAAEQRATLAALGYERGRESPA